MTQGLAGAWGWVRAAFPHLPARPVSEEAFCQARGRLRLRFWRELWEMVKMRYEELFRTQMLWKGRYRLLAADGTEIDLPNVPAVAQHFPRPRTKHGQSKSPQARIVALCSVLTGFCVDFTFFTRRLSEQLGLQHLIRRVRENDLLLLDRGFFSLCAAASHTGTPSPLRAAGAGGRGALRAPGWRARPGRLVG
jgi:hypothetical protein